MTLITSNARLRDRAEELMPGGVTVATAKKLIEQGIIPKNESCVICITGNGLKTQEAVSDHIGKPYRIKPSLESFEKSLRNESKIKEEVWQSK